MQKSQQQEQLVAVKWNRPGSRFHGVVHFVSKALVTPNPTTTTGNDVVVLWPRKGKSADRGRACWWIQLQPKVTELFLGTGYRTAGLA